MGFRDGLEKTTASTLFLVRGLGLKLPDLRKLGFMNAYIDDVDHEPHYQNAVYLLFKPLDMDDFGFFAEQEQLRTTLIVEDYDYDGGYVVLVYMFPDQFLPEYKHFLTGDYSEFRMSYTKLFPEEVMTKEKFGIGSKKMKSVHYHVFNRTTELREYWEGEIGQELDDDMEYWSAPDIDKETLNIQRVRESELEEQSNE